MANVSMNQYENQLYSVFKTFDVDNNEALDRSAVLELCDTLQLENRGTALVDTLFEKHTDRVTFAQFRNGLLSVLGGESPPKTEYSESKPISLSVHSTSPQGHSDEDSSGQEVAPKFVFGSKKYGRRSRPPRGSSEESPRQRVSSESRLDCERARSCMKCKRSASAMESHSDSLIDNDSTNLDHDKRINKEQALALCHGLNMHGVDHSLVHRIFEVCASDMVTVGEFFEKLNASLTSALSVNEAATEKVTGIDNNIVSSESVIEVWERAGVQKPRRLLMELGFTSPALRPAELERALDAEIHALALPSNTHMDAKSLVLLAAHALACLRLDSARRQFDIVRSERDKLCQDLGEANRRARILAQDVDENHARIESELKSSLRQLEAKHAEALRAASEETVAEKEKAASLCLELEAEIARRLEIEARLRTEIATLIDQNEDFKERIRTTESRLAQAERDQARMQAEAREAEDREAGLVEREKAAADELAVRLQELRIENQRLRDRNDELCAELEANVRPACGDSTTIAASWREESAIHYPSTLLNDSESAEESDSFLISNVDINSNKTLINRLREILEIMKKMPDSDGKCENCKKNQNVIPLLEAVHEWCERTFNDLKPVNEDGKMEVALQTDLNVNEEVAALNKKLFEVIQRHDADQQSLTAVIKELELSLEQMKEEYDSSEVYWTGKLEEERAAWASEQRAGDERLAALAAQVAAYERAYCRLPAIDERRSLERHVAELDAQAAAAERDLARKDEEIKQLNEELKQQKGRLQEMERRAGGGAAWGGALRARCVRAERAAQRLLARLAAADALVRDLYLENCRLAHRAPR